MTATVAQALQTAHTLGLDRLDAQWLLLHTLGKPASARAWLLAHDDDVLPEAPLQTFRSLALRRAAGEPLAYIVGHKPFFGLCFNVDPRVLVPRPDTETLVQWALDALCSPADWVNPRLLDLGTGSGAVAIAVAHTLQSAGQRPNVLAVDSSADALAVARENARQLNADVQFVESDWFTKVSGHYHVIASNPPYIATADPHLAALTHEPLSALTAGVDGLQDLRQIITEAPSHLVPGGWLLLEHGHNQSQAVCALLNLAGFRQVCSRADLAGIARCSGGQWPD